MKVTTVSVRVSKMFSDGNYGHQQTEVSYTAEVGDGEDPEQVTIVLMARATAQVRVQLGESETLNIRRAVNPQPRVCGYCQIALLDWDNYSHKACEEQKRAERDVARAAQNEEWNRQRESEEALAVIGAQPLNMHDSGEVLDGSDLSEQEVEWIADDVAFTKRSGVIR